MRRLASYAATAVAALVLAACTGNTQPATNVDHDSATLNADVTWKQQDNTNGGEWRWEYGPVGAGFPNASAWFAMPPCAQTECAASPSFDVSGLTPDSDYNFRLAARINGQTRYGDQNGYNANDDPPYEYDGFTTATAPTGGGYPSIPPAQVDFDGDFDTAGQTVGGDGGWVNDYTTGTSKQVRTDGPGEGQHYVRITDNSNSGGTRGELGSGSRPAGGEYTYEFLLYIPSGVNFIGFVAQTKLDEIAGSCANGGWSFPQDEASLMLRVRSDCDADYRDLDFGNPPRDRWFAVKAHQTFLNSGGVAEAQLDPDGAGPQPYGPVKSVTGDTTSGGAVKFRIGKYGTGVSGQWFAVDGYHLNVH